MAELSTIIRGKALIEPVLGDTKPLIDSIKTPSLIGDNKAVVDNTTLQNGDGNNNEILNSIFGKVEEISNDVKNNKTEIINEREIVEVGENNQPISDIQDIQGVDTQEKSGPENILTTENENNEVKEVPTITAAGEKPNPETLSNQNQITEDVDDIKETLDEINDNLTDKVLPNPAPESQKESVKETVKENEEEESKDKKEKKYGVNGITGVAQAGERAYESLLNGNSAAALRNTISGGQDAVKSFADMAKEAGDSELTEKLLGANAAMQIGSILIGVADATRQKYLKALPGMDSLLTQFGGLTDINKNNYESNQQFAQDLRNQMSDKAINTGLSNDDFIKLVNSISSYGLNVDKDKDGKLIMGSAADIAKEAANYKRLTGVDEYQAANFAAQYERFSGNKGDGVKALNYAYNAAQQSGIQREQFGEYLAGLESIMEEGISKGFLKSIDDIGTNIAFVSELAKGTSGEKFFKGDQVGARNYQQMSNAMASATSLNDTGNLLVFRAMSNAYKDDEWLDTMKKIEKGDWGDEKFLTELKKVVEFSYGDKKSQIAQYKNIFGTNWTMASEIYDIIQNVGKKAGVGEEIKKTVTGTEVNPEVESYTTVTQNASNKLDKELTAFSKQDALKMVDTQNAIADDIKYIRLGEEKIIEGFNRIMRQDYKINGEIVRGEYTDPYTGATTLWIPTKDLLPEKGLEYIYNGENYGWDENEEALNNKIIEYTNMEGVSADVMKTVADLMAKATSTDFGKFTRDKERGINFVIPNEDLTLQAIQILTEAINNLKNTMNEGVVVPIQDK